jgi:hypothetical protein
MNCVKCNHPIGRTTTGTLFHVRGANESDFSVTCWKCECREPTAPVEAAGPIDTPVPVVETFNAGAITSGWRRAYPKCHVVCSPEEYVHTMETFIKNGSKGDNVIVIDWNDEEQSELWLKEVSKCMQVCGLLVKQTYQTEAKK